MTGRLIANGFELDLTDGVAIPLNFSIADVKNPQKRKRNHSKDVKLYGTSNNMNFFTSTYQLSLTDLDSGQVGFNFDPTKRVEVKYYKGSLLAFDGLMQLNEVEIDGKDYYFNCTLFSNFIDLFMRLGERKVADLGWSEYDHALTRTNAKNSWDTSVKVNGVDTPNFTGSVPDGFGYVYPLADYGFNSIPTTFSLVDVVPLVYVKEIIEKCAQVAEFNIDSDWLNSDRVKKMLFGFEGGRRRVLTSDQIDARHLEAESDFYKELFLNYSQSLGFGQYNYQQDVIGGYLIGRTADNRTTTVIDDPSNIFNNSTNSILYNGLPGNYKIQISGSFQQTLNLSGSQTYAGGSHGFIIEFRKYGQVIDSVSAFSNNGDAVVGVNYNKTFEFSSDNNNNVYIEITFKRIVNLSIAGDGEPIEFINETPIPFSYEINCLDGVLNDGNTLTLAPVIPDMKARDFMEDIIKAHNLYISDPDIFNTIKIEPLEDYYLGTDDTDDWTQIIDHSKPIKIKPASTIEGKVYKFSFADEEDYDNERYKEEFNQRYGNLDWVVESTYQTGERPYELRFGQAVPIELVNSDIVLPRIVKLQNNVFVPYKGKPKIYFYNGLKTGNWRFTNVIPDSGFEDLTEYPSIHHFDDWENPTFDWNWQLPSRIYYGNSNTIVTTANLFTVYHEKFVRELTGRDSKLVECFVKLSPEKINTLNFARLIMWNGVVFRLNEIKDFDSDVAESTKAELLRVIQADSLGTFTGYTEAIGEELVDRTEGGTGTDEDTGVIFGGIGIASNSIILRG